MRKRRKNIEEMTKTDIDNLEEMTKNGIINLEEMTIRCYSGLSGGDIDVFQKKSI